jgi:hypothetical protein
MLLLLLKELLLLLLWELLLLLLKDLLQEKVLLLVLSELLLLFLRELLLLFLRELLSLFLRELLLLFLRELLSLLLLGKFMGPQTRRDERRCGHRQARCSSDRRQLCPSAFLPGGPVLLRGAFGGPSVPPPVLLACNCTQCTLKVSSQCTHATLW